MGTLSRRKFLLGSACAVVAFGALGTSWALRPPATERRRERCQGRGEMSKRVLVAYATKCGSTGEIAEQVG